MRTAFFPRHTPDAGQQWLAYDWLLWPALWLLALAISRLTDIDMTLASGFYDPVARQFPLSHDPFWAKVLHDDVKHLNAGLWVLLLAATLRAWRRQDLARYEPMVFVLLTSAAVVLLNGVLKNHSAHSCPWSLSVFGGNADYFRLLGSLPTNPGPGHCLPSGHAGVAFMWWPAVYACARWRPQWRWPAALLVTGFGVFCGYVQMVRGAHFLTHILIAAAVCGGISSLAYHLPDLAAFLRKVGGLRTRVGSQGAPT